MYNPKKGVSPVIATVLIIALTVASGATVWVVVDKYLSDDVPKFFLSEDVSYDYNNDGKIDAILLNVKNPEGFSASASFVSLEDWKIAPGYNVTIDAGTEVKVLIVTGSKSAQLETSKTVNIGLSPLSNVFAISEIVLGEVSIPRPVKILVKRGESPVSGTMITFKDSDGIPVSTPPLTTDVNGQAEAYLLPNWYIAKTSSGLESDLFHPVLNATLNIASVAESINVKVIDGNNSPLSGITVYDADINQNDLGDTKVTNSSGLATFTKSIGNYLFRIEYLAQTYWSSQVNVPGSSGNTITIKITSGQLIGKLLLGGEPGGNRKLLRLYTSTNSSLGKYSYTNTTSHFSFTSGITSGLYRLRLDYQGKYYWSGLVSTATENLEVDFGGGTLDVIVKVGGAPLPNRVLTRLFKSNNASAGRYDYVNATGIATYTATPQDYYRLRVDWLGQYFWTQLFYHTGTPITVDIGGGRLDIGVTVGPDDPLPNRVLTRLFRENNRSAGRYDYVNASGFAEYGAIPEGDYRLRIDWLGKYYWTTAFHHDGDPQYLDINGGRLDIEIKVGNDLLPNRVLTRLFRTDNRYAGRYDYVNASGFAEYGALPGGDYKLRIDWLGQYFWTNTFTHNGSVQYLNISGGKLDIEIKVGDTALPNRVLTRLFRADNRYAGRYDYVNASGYAEYGTIPEGTFKLRIDWLGKYFWTNTFTHNGSVQHLNISGGRLDIEIKVGNDLLPNRVLTRLFRTDNRYAGRYDYVNASGYAEYGVIPEGDFKLRIDWLGRYYWTNSFTHNGSVQHLNISGGKLNIQVFVGGQPLPNRVLTRLFRTDNRYAGRYDYVNASGMAEYGTIPEGDYKLRIDWLGQYFWTSNFNHNGTTVIQDIGGGSLNILITIDGVPLPQNVLTRLFRADNRYAGRYDYVNASGYAEYGAIPNAQFKLRIDWMGNYYWTSTFTHDGSVQQLSITGVGAMEIKVTLSTGPLSNNQLIRLYNSNGRYTGRYAYSIGTNVTFSPVPAGDYYIRYNGKNSAVFTAASSLEVIINMALILYSSNLNLSNYSKLKK